MDDLLRKAFDKNCYSYKLDSSVLQNILPTDPKAANNEIAELGNKRFVVSTEADPSIPLNNKTIKELTGESDIKARKIYKSETTTKLSNITNGIQSYSEKTCI